MITSRLSKQTEIEYTYYLSQFHDYQLTIEDVASVFMDPTDLSHTSFKLTGYAESKEAAFDFEVEGRFYGKSASISEIKINSNEYGDDDKAQIAQLLKAHLESGGIDFDVSIK